MDGNDDRLADFFARQKGNDQQQLPISRPLQEQYGELWPSSLFVGQASFPLQGWNGQYNLPALSPQDLRSQVNRCSGDTQGQAPDLSQFAPNQDLVNNASVETYIKPAEEGPPILGFAFNGYSGLYVKNEASPCLKSDQGSTLDSAYYSEYPAAGLPKYKQESPLDTRSEASARSGAHLLSPTRPRIQAGGSFGEYRSTASSGTKRKRTTQPPPVCELCGFQPKNRSDAT